MITYALVIIEGCLHERTMTITIGGREIGLNCGEVKRFIRRANDIGIDAALDKIVPDTSEGRAVMRLMYEEFKDEVIT